MDFLEDFRFIRTIIQNYGFMNKFKNESRQSPIQDNVFSNVVEAVITQKVSGFMGQIIPLPDGTFVACSKNSADSNSVFVKDIIRIFKNYETEELSHFLQENKFHLCAEFMSLNDQTHGHSYNEEVAWILAIGTGNYFDITHKSNDSVDNCIHLLSPNDRINICHRFGLPCSSIYVSDDVINIQKLGIQLSKNRDKMLYDTFQHIIEHSGFTEIQGTKSIGDISQIMEGLVISLKHNDCNKNTLKYKFPNYTSQTMFIRNQISRCIKNEGGNLTTMVSKNTNIKLEKYLNSWVVSEREYWRKKLYRVCLELSEYFHVDNIPGNNNIGYHIRITNLVSSCGCCEEEMIKQYKKKIELDFVNNKYNDNFSKYSSIIKLSQNEIITDMINKIENIHGNIVFAFVGPQGIGKSTISHEIKKLYGDRVSLCSADMFQDFSRKFNTGRLSLVHKQCQMKAFNSLIEGKIVIIDNTNMTLKDMYPYVSMSSILKCPFYAFTIAPDLWLTRKQIDTEFIDYLENSCNIRYNTTPEKCFEITRKTIEKTIIKARGNIRSIALGDVSKWLQTDNILKLQYPFKQGIVNQGSIMYKSRVFEIMVKKAIILLKNSGNYKNLDMDATRVLIRNGFSYHITLVSPNNVRLLSKNKTILETFLSDAKQLNLLNAKVKGIGFVKGKTFLKKESYAYFVVYEWPELQELLLKYNLPPVNPHVTISIGHNGDVFFTHDGNQLNKNESTIIIKF